MMASMPDDMLQMVPSMPSVSRPPLSSFAILTIWSWTILMTSPGATRASVEVIASRSPSMGR
jgi:hypothetical protein